MKNKLKLSLALLLANMVAAAGSSGDPVPTALGAGSQSASAAEVAPEVQTVSVNVVTEKGTSHLFGDLRTVDELRERLLELEGTVFDIERDGKNLSGKDALIDGMDLFARLVPACLLHKPDGHLICLGRVNKELQLCPYIAACAREGYLSNLVDINGDLARLPFDLYIRGRHPRHSWSMVPAGSNIVCDCNASWQPLWQIVKMLDWTLLSGQFNNNIVRGRAEITDPAVMSLVRQVQTVYGVSPGTTPSEQQLRGFTENFWTALFMVLYTLQKDHPCRKQIPFVLLSETIPINCTLQSTDEFALQFARDNNLTISITTTTEGIVIEVNAEVLN